MWFTFPGEPHDVAGELGSSRSSMYGVYALQMLDWSWSRAVMLPVKTLAATHIFLCSFQILAESRLLRLKSRARCKCD